MQDWIRRKPIMVHLQKLMEKLVLKCLTKSTEKLTSKTKATNKQTNKHKINNQTQIGQEKNNNKTKMIT